MRSNFAQHVRWIETHSAILLAGIVCLSLAVNFAVLASWGARFGGDSARYIDGSDRIVHHLGLVGKESSYLGYILFLAFLSQLHLSTTGVATVQIGVAALAGLALHELGNQLAGRIAGLLSVAVFLLNPDIFRWNLFILTDALYVDFVIFACWSIWKASEGDVWQKILAFGFVLCTASVRPNGWLMPLIALCYWIVLRARLRAAKLVLLAVVVLTLGYGFDRVQFFGAAIANENPVGALDNRVIVLGYPRTRPALNEASSTSLQWRELSRHAIRNPGRAAALAALRIAAEFGHVRPFYSVRHNVAILLALPVIYIFALYGFYHLRSNPLVLLIGSIILYHTLIVAAFFADWDGRFLLHFFPLIGVLSGAGASLLIDHRAGRSCRSTVKGQNL